MRFMDAMKAAHLARRLRRFKKDSTWLHARFDMLRRKYPNEFVAVYREAVVAHSKSMRQLHSKLKEVCPGTLQDTAVEYLPKQDLELIL